MRADQRGRCPWYPRPQSLSSPEKLQFSFTMVDGTPCPVQEADTESLATQQGPTSAGH